MLSLEWQLNGSEINTVCTLEVGKTDRSLVIGLHVFNVSVCTRCTCVSSICVDHFLRSCNAKQTGTWLSTGLA